MKRVKALLVVGALLIPALAAAQDITRDWDKSYDFSKIKTFAIEIGTSWNNQLSENRVLNEIASTLQEKGWKKVDDKTKANALVVLHGATQVKHEINSFYSGGGAGWGGWGYAGGGFGTGTTTVSDYLVGTLVVDIFEVGTKKLLYRGSASDEIDKDPPKNQKKIEKSSEKLFKDFPTKDKK
jgi:hypothetical protein